VVSITTSTDLLLENRQVMEISQGFSCLRLITSISPQIQSSD